MILKLTTVSKNIFFNKKKNFFFKFIVLSKLKEIKDKLDDFAIRINILEKKMAELQKDRFNKPEQKDWTDVINKIKNDLENLKNAHSQTLSKVLENKEQIKLLFARLEDIIKNYKTGDENLQKQIDDLKKFIKQKLDELSAQIEILLKAPPGAAKSDLSALTDLLKKLNILEREFNEFVEKVNIEEIYRQLKFLKETKTDKKDLELLKDKYEEHSIEIDALKKRLDGLFTQLLSRKDDGKAPVINIDFSQYVSKIDFEKHKKENENEFKKIWEELNRLKDLIDKIFEILKTKANLTDLDDLKDFLLGKIDELAIACNKKFADKNETANNFKYLDDQIKKILEMLANLKTNETSANDTDNWLIAKKPINGYSCAACEAYIGDLRDDTQKFIPWNRMPLRDPGDKLYRMGNGFSKMLQMLNFDNNGNVCLNPNVVNENTVNSNESASRVASAFPVNNNNVSNNKNLLKKRIQSANPKMKSEIKFNSNKVNLQQNNKEGNNNNEMGLPKIKNDMMPDIYEKNSEKNDEGPKITRVYRKGSSKNGNGNNIV